MQVFNLTQDVTHLYTANVYFIMSDWKAVKDVTVMIDAGQDSSIVYKIRQINTGLGKRKIDKLVITHNHSDHSAMLPLIYDEFKPEILAATNIINGIQVDTLLHDGQFIKISDYECEIFHITSHSFDSVCLYCSKEQVLFSGDTTFPVKLDSPDMKSQNLDALVRLSKKNITTVYPGHGPTLHFAQGEFKVFESKI